MSPQMEEEDASLNLIGYKVLLNIIVQFLIEIVPMAFFASVKQFHDSTIQLKQHYSSLQGVPQEPTLCFAILSTFTHPNG